MHAHDDEPNMQPARLAVAPPHTQNMILSCVMCRILVSFFDGKGRLGIDTDIDIHISTTRYLHRGVFKDVFVGQISIV